MGIKQLYNDNLRKLPNEYGDVSVMQNFTTIFHSVQEIGPFLLFQSLELGKALADEKCHFAISWTESC